MQTIIELQEKIERLETTLEDKTKKLEHKNNYILQLEEWIIGVIERSGHSLFCSTLFFDPIDGLVNKHRKLMPTASERLIWSLGDGSTMPVVESAVGRIASAICWENYMPLFRSTMYAKCPDIWCASTVDDRETWRSSMRHIACEGRCFVVSACQFQPSPASLSIKVDALSDDRPMIRGGSVIISPLGELLTEPLLDKDGLVTAEINIKQIAEARYDLDVNGHYSRPDIFSLHVDERHKQGIVTTETITDAVRNVKCKAAGSDIVNRDLFDQKTR